MEDLHKTVDEAPRDWALRAVYRDWLLETRQEDDPLVVAQDWILLHHCCATHHTEEIVVSEKHRALGWQLHKYKRLKIPTMMIERYRWWTSTHKPNGDWTVPVTVFRVMSDEIPEDRWREYAWYREYSTRQAAEEGLGKGLNLIGEPQWSVHQKNIYLQKMSSWKPLPLS